VVIFRQGQVVQRLTDPEHKVRRNVGKCLTNDTVQQPRRNEFSATIYIIDLLSSN